MSFLEVYFGSTSNHSTKRLVVLANGRESVWEFMESKKKGWLFSLLMFCSYGEVLMFRFDTFSY